MRAQWLNDDLTEAIITVGIWRQRQAHVRIGEARRTDGEGGSREVKVWTFVPTSRELGGFRTNQLNNLRIKEVRRRARIRHEVLRGKEWQPVRSDLPEMRLLAEEQGAELP